MRLIFMGTPDFAVPTLTALVGYGHEIVCVYSQPPRPGGRRGLEPVKSPVHRQAEILGLDVRTPASMKDEAEQDAFRSLDADAAVVVAYGQILPGPVLGGTRYGCYNGHASLLPRWRGAAPINRAIMAGDDETGIMVMKMDEGLDTGHIAMEERVSIGPDMTAGELHDQLMMLGADLMQRAMAALERQSLTLTPQEDDGATYARKISKDETRIDFSLSVRTVHNHIRGLSPFPGAWCAFETGSRSERIKVLRSEIAEGRGVPGTVLDDRLTVACNDGAVRLIRLQKAGGRAMDAAEFLRGLAIPTGSVLG